jgi:HEAT repeat protein
MEPVWGGRADTASNLRGICLLALPACSDLRREAVFRCLVDGLTDPAQTVRAEAARSVAQMGGDEAALLLRLKARSGESEPRVIGQVFDSLLAVEGSSAVPFVAAFLESGKEGIAAEAALSLGASRLEAAIEALQRAWSGTRDPDLRDALARALSASRQPQALAFLLDLVRNGRAAEATVAREALAIHRESPEIWRQVEAAAREAGG